MRRTLVLLLMATGAALIGCEFAGLGRGAGGGGPALAPAPAGQADLVAEYRSGVRMKRLENELVILTKENHAAPVVSVQVVLRAGSLWEEEYDGSGISHLTEHLVAGGSTANRPEGEIEKRLGDIGAVTNAYTGPATTTYFIDATPEHIDAAVELLADTIQNALIEPKEFEREWGVVQREILNGAADTDRQAAYLLQAAMFPNMPQGLRVIGYYENIQKLTREDVWRYYRRRYVPSNAVVCAAGDFDGAAVLAKLEAAFGGWKGPRATPVGLPEPAPPVSDLVVCRELDSRLTRAVIAYPSCRLSSPDLYALDVLAGILGRGDSSRLGSELKVKRNLVYDVSAWNYTPEWPGGEFTVSFSCEPGKVDEARRAVAAELSRVCREAPGREEVEKVKRQVMAEHLFEGRTAHDQARSLSADQLTVGDPFFSARYVETLQKVTPGEVQGAARKYLEGARSVTAIVLPKGSAAVQETGAAAEAKPSTTRVVLPENGLTLLVYRTPGQPAVSLVAAMKAGQSIETESTAGISALAAEYLPRGTRGRSEAEIAQFFDGIGGTINAASGWNSIYVEALALKGDWEQAAAVWADVVLHPSFPASLLESTRVRQVARLKATTGDAFGECGVYFGEQFFTGSPYRWPGAGTVASLQGMTVEDVGEFYSRVRVGRNMVVGVSGDVEPAEVEKLLGRLFKDLPAGEKVTPPAVAPRRVEAAEVYVKQTAKPSAVVMVGWPGMELDNLRDRPAMDVFGTIAAGYQMPRGWLHDTLRGQSLVYAVHFGTREGLLPGYERAASLCQPEQVNRVARLMTDLLYRGRSYAYTEDDLRSAKTIIRAARQMELQSPESVARLMALDELYGLGYDFEERYLKLIAAVTADDVRRVAAEYIQAPVVCITTPKPEAVSSEELRRPFDAGRLEELLKASPPTPSGGGTRRME